jgi:phosphoenolpyruvate synthase (EC 2.7.9.2)
MQEPVLLHHNQIVLTDEKGLVAIYPYRDADSTRVTMATVNIHLVTCGVPGISREKLVTSYELCVRYLKEFNGGSAASGPVLSPPS